MKDYLISNIQPRYRGQPLPDIFSRICFTPEMLLHESARRYCCYLQYYRASGKTLHRDDMCLFLEAFGRTGSTTKAIRELRRSGYIVPKSFAEDVWKLPTIYSGEYGIRESLRYLRLQHRMNQNFACRLRREEYGGFAETSLPEYANERRILEKHLRFFIRSAVVCQCRALAYNRCGRRRRSYINFYLVFLHPTVYWLRQEGYSFPQIYQQLKEHLYLPKFFTIAQIYGLYNRFNLSAIAELCCLA